MSNHEYCRALLTRTRKELPKGAPKNLSATGPMFRDTYLVEDGKGFAVEVEGDCKWDAQTKALNLWSRKQGA